ncbi:tRNA (adenosine(37)-N6)-threonylcarbamoyltransferase complex dimerization subunit type 1 TsaB [Euzebya tangerina]|uniref:tRNA (adenosine(37)-N6)-threonylcarbamoyltransferase complex dimerization subunit type 1 TsaB n=1 Tax=Euzebya tangerina TaxID=591198 RepID=UPI000E30FBE4|nr:tRNA (adenosine(37)-N6)-threonylcarbamoyltransferase complex dimerization subunit type 1 TsaB [Euzebya tangerina]
MLVLGVETSTSAASVCLATRDGIAANAQIGPGLPHLTRAHGSFVAPAIQYCLATAGVEASAVTGVAVSLGPGLFTGMRVGIATAQAFAHARGLPVVGLASLDLLAFRWRHVPGLVCSVLDARRGELFWATYRAVPGGIQRVGEFHCGRPDVLAAEIEATAEDTLCVGDGAALHRGLLASAGADVIDGAAVHPSAAALAKLAMPKFIREDTTRPELLQPIYLRQADAQINWSKRGALFGGRGEG